MRHRASESKSLRLLHVITGLNTGGAETVLCRLLEALRPPAFEHTVISLLRDGTLSGRVAALAKLHHLNMRRGWASPTDVLRLRRLIRTSDPDVVQGWMYHANVLTSWAALGTGLPVVWGIRQSLHDYPSNGRSTRLAIQAGRCCSRLPAVILYNSTISADQHRAFGYSGKRRSVIPNGFDTKLFALDLVARARVRAELNIAENEIAVGLVARVDPMKDHSSFLRAAALLARKCPRAVFVLVGDGTAADEFKFAALIDELDLRSRVRLCGRRTDIAAVNNALDIASLASYGEAFPNVVAEAMACGTPCVATDVGDVREIVGDSGLVVPPHESEALAAGWAKLIELGPDARRVLGERARVRIAERYSLNAMAQQYAALYQRLASKSGARR